MIIFCILRILFRSTRHSAVVCLSADMVHCPPYADRSVYRPSTALSDPQGWSGKGLCCQDGLCKARFSASLLLFHSLNTCQLLSIYRTECIWFIFLIIPDTLISYLIVYDSFMYLNNFTQNVSLPYVFPHGIDTIEIRKCNVTSMNMPLNQWT